MQSDRPSRWVLWLSSYKWWILATLLLAGLGWWLLVERPMTFYRSALGASEAHKEALEIQDRALTTGAQIFLGLAVLIGAYLTFRRVRAAEKQAEAAHEGQLTERFTRGTRETSRVSRSSLRKSMTALAFQRTSLPKRRKIKLRHSTAKQSQW